MLIRNKSGSALKRYKENYFFFRHTKRRGFRLVLQYGSTLWINFVIGNRHHQKRYNSTHCQNLKGQNQSADMLKRMPCKVGQACKVSFQHKMYVSLLSEFTPCRYRLMYLHRIFTKQCTHLWIIGSVQTFACILS